MTGHVFIDESKRRDFVLVAGALLPGPLTSARQQIKGLYLPNQRGIHMVNEKPGRQRSILKLIDSLGVEVTVYVAPKGAHKTELLARQRCLEELVKDIARLGHSHLCIDRDDTVAAEDRRIIRHQLEVAGYRDQLHYSHSKVHSEPLLLIPDAIAWAWPQSRWRGRCSNIVRRVQEV